MSDAKFNAQIEGLINGLQAGGKKDIICEASGLKVVLPTCIFRSIGNLIPLETG